jgi:hypothetical protein
MRISRAARLLFLCGLLPASLSARQSTSTATSSQPVQRDPQAVLLVQSAVSSAATVAPTDSVAAGSVSIVAGSETSTGTIQIQTLGTNQTSVQVQTEDANWTVIYSQGLASQTVGGIATGLSLEAASTSQCVYFPLPYLAGILQNPDVALQYIGSETLNGASAQHIRATDTFQSNPSFQYLSSFTVTDVWLDSASGLPRRISFTYRDGGGATPKIPVTIDYSTFQNFGGVLYPSQILQSVNGTPWMTVSIESVRFNTGLTNSNFPVATGGN